MHRLFKAVSGFDVAAEDLTLYLVLDEAHRGFNTRASSDKQTIVRRLVNGTKTRPPIPIVWGISATIAHFESAMQEAEATRNRRALPSVVVDPARVRYTWVPRERNKAADRLANEAMDDAAQGRPWRGALPSPATTVESTAEAAAEAAMTTSGPGEDRSAGRAWSGPDVGEPTTLVLLRDRWLRV